MQVHLAAILVMPYREPSSMGNAGSYLFNDLFRKIIYMTYLY